MDTPLHAAAVPDADRSTLKDPAVAARELLEAIANALPGQKLQSEREGFSGTMEREGFSRAG
jgi:hypothetical protein